MTTSATPEQIEASAFDFDREADRIFGLTVEFRDGAWCVMSDARVVERCGAYEDATAKRLETVNAYLPKLDQISINGFLRADRIAALRSDLIRRFDAPVRNWDRPVSKLAYEVEVNGSVYFGESNGDEEEALTQLLASLDREGSEHLMGVA